MSKRGPSRRRTGCSRVRWERTGEEIAYDIDAPAGVQVRSV